MKSTYLLLVALLAGLIFFTSTVVSQAAPIGWDFTSGIVRLLAPANTAQVRVPSIVATSSATSTLPVLAVPTRLSFGGVIGTAWSDFCTAITGGSGLCDGTDATGSATTTINGASGPTFTFATGSAGTNFNIATSAGTVTLNIPTASASNRGVLSTSDWSAFTAAAASTTALSPTYIRGLFSATSPVNLSAGGVISINNDGITDTQLAFNTGQNLNTVSSPTFASTTMTNLTSALVRTTAGGVLEEYTGTTCTNQFATVLSALGVATCASVSTTTLTATGYASGYVLQASTTASGGWTWVATSTLGISGGSGSSGTSTQVYSYIVKASGGGTHTTIQGAMDACGLADGGSIYLADTTYAQAGTGLRWKGSNCNIYGVNGSTTITFTGATTLFKTNSAVGLYSNNGVHDVVITADGNTSGIALDWSDMSNQIYSNITMDNVGTPIRINDTQDITFYNEITGFAFTTVTNIGINASSTNPTNANRFINGFIGYGANKIGAQFNNSNGSLMQSVRLEPGSTTGTKGLYIWDSPATDGVFGNRFEDMYIEGNAIGIQIDATLGSGGGIQRNMFNGMVEANTTDLQLGTGISAKNTFFNITDSNFGSPRTSFQLPFGIGTTTGVSGLNVQGESSGSIVAFFSNTGTKFMEMLNTGVTTLFGTWNFGGASVTLPSTTTIGANSFIRSGAHNLTLTTTNTTVATLPSGTITLAELGSAMTGTFDGNNFGGGAIGTGDLLYGSGAGTIAELAMGASSTILTTNGTTPAWTTLSSLCVAITGSASLCDGDDASGGGGGGALSTTTDQIGDGGVQAVSYVTGDVMFGGSASTSAEFQFDDDGAKFIISSTTNTNATATIESSNLAQAVRIGDDIGSGLEWFFGTAGDAILRPYGSVIRLVIAMAETLFKGNVKITGNLSVASTTYNGATTSDAILVNGYINSGEWQQEFCTTPIAETTQVVADTLRGCGRYAYSEDSAGALDFTMPTTGTTTYFRLRAGATGTTAATGDGMLINWAGGIDFGDIQKNLPAMEWAMRQDTMANATATLVMGGISSAVGVNADAAAEPAQGFYVMATTSANWLFACNPSSGNTTYFNTGIASSTTGTASNNPFTLFRLEISGTTNTAVTANLKAKTPSTDLVTVATCTQNNSASTQAVGPYVSIAKSTAGLASELHVPWIKFWYKTPLF